MIEATALCKRFGQVDAVSAVSFTARDGEITGVLGPNGAGKSTCLRMLYGVLTPDSGSARIDGLDIRGETSAARAHLGVLPHAAGLYNNLSARENIAYFGALQGMGRDRLKARTAELAAALGMAGFIDRRVKGFSQVQRIKVALARAFPSMPVIATATFGVCSLPGSRTAKRTSSRRPLGFRLDGCGVFTKSTSTPSSMPSDHAVTS